MARTPYSLPESEKVPLTKEEVHCIQWFMLALSTLMGARKTLGNRLDQVPNGRARLNMAVGQTRALYDDIKGTINQRQWRHISATATDNEARLVPKFTPQKINLVFTKEDAMELINAALCKCVKCPEFNEDSERCKLRQLLEVIIPLSDYGGMLCPYSRAEWE